MAATVAVVQTTAAGNGAPVAVDVVGTTAFQQVKLIGGAIGVTAPIDATTATPAAGAVGMVVRQIEPVSGTVSISGTQAVSGTLTITPTILTVNTAATIAGASVTAQVSGTLTITPTILTVNTAATIAGASVTIQQGASVVAQASGTITITPTVLTVNTAATVAGASVTIQQGASVSAVVSGTVNIGTIATQLGTQVVSVVPGLSVSAVVSGTVNVATVATVLTIVTQLGTQHVTGTIQNVATVATILGTQVVTLATGGSVAALDVGRTQVILIVPVTSVGISGTMLLFTAYQGLSQSAAGTTGYVVPAGKTFRVLSVALIAANSVTTSPAVHRMFVVQSTAAPTWVSTVPIVAAVGVRAVDVTQNYSACAVAIADIPAGATVGIAHTIATSGGTILQAVVNGYLFP